MAGDREKALEEGFTGYLEKPLDPERFAVTILTYLQASSGMVKPWEAGPPMETA
jgi:CheY-like chemotaxis protein